MKDIEERYPRLFTETHRERNPSDSTSSVKTSSDTTSKALDVSTVMKVSGAISGEIVLEKLLVKLMKIIIENAGAQKGFLIMEKEGRLVIGAEGQAGSDEVRILQDAPVEKSGSLYKVLQSLKAYTAGEANKILHKNGAFWQHESYDHVVRDGKELERIIDYVLHNPVKAGMVSSREQWKWSYCRK